MNVLGPLQVVASNGGVSAGPPKQRALLCLLVMYSGRVLSPESIIDHLWGEHPPTSAAANLHVYVSQLRRQLEPERGRHEPPQVLVSAGGGYGLRPVDIELDVRELTVEGTTAEVTVERALNDWSLAGSGWQRTRAFTRPGRTLRKRLAEEAARRGQPIPTVRRV